MRLPNLIKLNNKSVFYLLVTSCIADVVLEADSHIMECANNVNKTTQNVFEVLLRGWCNPQTNQWNISAPSTPCDQDVFMAWLKWVREISTMDEKLARAIYEERMYNV